MVELLVGCFRRTLSRGYALPLTASLLLAGCSSAADDTLGAEADSGNYGTSGADQDSAGTGLDPSGGGTGGAGDEGGEPPPDDTGADEEPEGSTGTTGEPVCDDQTPVELFLSPDDSNSMSSPAQVRAAVLDGWSSIQAVPIRTWEFMNYYGFDYPAAAPGSVVVTPQLYRDPEDPEGEYLLQIAVSSEELSNEERPPLNITLVLDTSGSMGGHPIDMLKESCRSIAGSLREGDVISMVTWATSNAIILGGHTVSGPDDPMLMSAIDGIDAGGGTDLHGGLVAGYELAEQNYDAERINRIVLVSDGGANVGITDSELIAAHAGGQDEDGVYMVGVGVGTVGTYNDRLMDEVTDAGKGASVFVSDAQEAQRVFRDDFVNTLAVAARDVQVRLDLPPGFEIVEFSGEEFSSDPQEVEPQHLSPNDAMVFHQRIATCAPELLTDDTEITVAAHYKDAISFAPAEVSATRSMSELLAGDNSQLLKGSAVFGYAEALKAYKKGEQEAVASALEALAAAEAALPGDPDLAEIREVLEAL